MSKTPLLSIITRSYQRPTELKRCIDSVLNQTDPDFEHIIVPDEIGHGIHWANRQITEQAYKLNGQYVYILDDDDYVVTSDFIKDFRILLENIDSSDVIICCGTLNGERYPKFWKEPLVRGGIAAPNFICRQAVFNRYAKFWDAPRAGDASFIQAVNKAGHKIFWWDYDVFWAESSCGFTEEQKIRYGLI